MHIPPRTSHHALIIGLACVITIKPEQLLALSGHRAHRWAPTRTWLRLFFLAGHLVGEFSRTMIYRRRHTDRARGHKDTELIEREYSVRLRASLVEAVP